MKTHMDLDAYFERIGYRGPQTATLATLNFLHELHPQAIAFENLNPFLRIPVRLDTESLQKKLIHSRRGGYCFEHNLLFKQVLETLGFTVQGLAARVVWNSPEDAITPRGHMLLLVKADGQNRIADVGFGGLTLTTPLLLEADRIQKTLHEDFRLIQTGERSYTMQANVRDEWKSTYRFDLQEQFLPDYEVTNWYLSNHPESHFITGLIAARTDNRRRYALRNNKLSIHHLDGDTEKHSLNTITEIKKVLWERFFLEIPKADEANEKLRQLITPDEDVS